MSRSVRRVALDFEWPLEKVWSGYLNPHYDLREKCADCNGDGGSAAWRLVHALWLPGRHGSVDSWSGRWCAAHAGSAPS